MLTELTSELDQWRALGRTATMWWRDDDAIEPTDALEMLLDVGRDVPISLAIIPESCRESLAERLRDQPNVAVLQHGFRHANYVAEGPGSEYPPDRLDSEVAAEIAAGKRLLTTLFGELYLPVFVPPYLTFDDRFLPLLAQNGIDAISRHSPRASAVVCGVRQVNTHVGLIEWTEPPSFGGPLAAEAEIVNHLKCRRLGSVDPDEPTGIITHHLVQDEPSYDFIRKLLATTASHGSARWLDGREVFTADD